MANILIIGGGVAGLSAGIYAQLNGHQATICEKHKVAGGNLTGWQRGDYHIDNCIHWLTGTNPNTDTYKTWKDLGALGGVEIYQGDTLYTSEHCGTLLSLHKDLEKTQKQMLDCSPEDKNEINSFISAVKALQKLCGVGGKEHNQKGGAGTMILNSPLLLKYYKMSTSELAERFSHPTLKRFITSLLGDGFGALALIMVFATFCGENGGIPAGGSLKMAERMADRFTSLGGRLLTGKEVAKINRQGGKAISVSFSDGTEEKADYFILTTDPAATFGKLIDVTMPRQLQKLYHNTAFSRFSSYHCAFACDTNELPFSGDYVFELPQKYHPILGNAQFAVREYAYEPSFAPSGKTVIQTISFCEETEARMFISLRKTDKKSYNYLKNEIAEACLLALTEKFPQLTGKLTCIDVWTPATYHRYTNSEIGSFMSFTLPAKTLPIRVSNRIKGLPNVILATQWQQSPGGLPIAAEGGKIAIQTILALEERAKRRALAKEQKKPLLASAATK